MNYRSSTGMDSRGLRRLVSTLIAICLPVFAATFFSGSFFKLGTLQPGEVVDASEAHVAHAASAGGHTAHSGPAVPGAPTLLTEVTIQNYAFHTQSITINVGDTVRWTNLDPDRHTSTSSAGLWDSGELAQNGTFAYTFTAPGTYTYYCARHPGMTGTITVTGGSTSTPQTTATGTPGTPGPAAPTPTGTPGTTGTAGSTTAGTPGTTGTPGGTTTGTPQPVCTPTGCLSVSITESGLSPA